MGGDQGSFFVRDDDVGERTPELEFFVELFVSRGIPVSYQIIPARLTEACADFLLATARVHPGLLEFGQHGLHHEMSVKGRRLKREFGPERPLEEQRAVIAEGRRILRERLGPEVPIEVFTPPQHKFDRNTVRCAAAEGYRVFSAASYASPHHRAAYQLGRWLGLSSILHHGISYDGGMRPEGAIFERSIAVAVDDGRGIRCAANDLPVAIARAARRPGPVGLMFHHGVYGGADGRKALTEIVAKLSEQGAAKFRRLADLAPAA